MGESELVCAQQSIERALRAVESDRNLVYHLTLALVEVKRQLVNLRSNRL